jgi:hypothetical protein
MKILGEGIRVAQSGEKLGGQLCALLRTPSGAQATLDKRTEVPREDQRLLGIVDNAQFAMQSSALSKRGVQPVGE